MSTIKLDILKNTSAPDNGVVYSDLELDIAFRNTRTDELFSKADTSDIQSVINEGAIKNSITNIINTSPGEKILNPLFGCGFGDILFMPITADRARLVGQSILTSITKFEPRVKVVNINVTPDVENSQYLIDFTINIIKFTNKRLNFKGNVGRSGFYIV